LALRWLTLYRSYSKLKKAPKFKPNRTQAYEAGVLGSSELGPFLVYM